MADLKPPFTKETAQKKVKVAQDLWNTKYVSDFLSSMALDKTMCSKKRAFIPCILADLYLWSVRIALDTCEYTSTGKGPSCDLACLRLNLNCCYFELQN